MAGLAFDMRLPLTILHNAGPQWRCVGGGGCLLCAIANAATHRIMPPFLIKELAICNIWGMVLKPVMSGIRNGCPIGNFSLHFHIQVGQLIHRPIYLCYARQMELSMFGEILQNSLSKEVNAPSGMAVLAESTSSIYFPCQVRTGGVSKHSDSLRKL